MEDAQRSPLRPLERITFGALGAILPILGNVWIVDLELTFQHMTPLTVLGFAVRVVVALVFGAVVGYASKDEPSLWKVLQLGVAAPALILALANGQQFKEAKVDGKPRGSLVAPAYAAEPQVAQARDGSTVKEFLRGLFGGSPSRNVDGSVERDPIALGYRGREPGNLADFDWEVFVVAGPPVLRSIRCVEYSVSPPPQRINPASRLTGPAGGRGEECHLGDATSPFGLTAKSSPGQYRVRADVKFRDSSTRRLEYSVHQP